MKVNIWQDGCEISDDGGDPVQITPLMLQQIQKKFKIDNGRNIAETQGIDPNEITEDQSIQISEELESIINCDSGDAEYKAVHNVLGEAFFLSSEYYGFEKTDDMQYVKKLSDSEFTIVEARYAEDKYLIVSGSVDTSDLFDKRGEWTSDGIFLVKAYYSSLEEFEESYDEDTRNQILAEMYFEETAYFELSWRLVGKEDVEEELKKELQIYC